MSCLVMGHSVLAKNPPRTRQTRHDCGKRAPHESAHKGLKGLMSKADFKGLINSSNGSTTNAMLTGRKRAIGAGENDDV
jgi:hypothetical protein